MSKREIKWLMSTGRVSVKRTQAAAARIQRSAASARTSSARGTAPRVTAALTATGKGAVAFRIPVEHSRGSRDVVAARARTVVA